jgi:2,5-diamino-6-(ribosylamino)-4(3H)-pyrimidinone 5'-phosphate reductase
MEKPWISVNFAISADGKISPVKKRPSGWTSEADHRRLLELRAGADALLVGKGTLVADKMTMTVPGNGKQPLRCIVSRSGQLDRGHPIFQKPGGEIHFCITGDHSMDLPRATVHRESLEEFLSTLATDLAVKRLHCEGGGELVRELMELDAIDEFHLTLAGHTLFGGAEAATVTGAPGGFSGKSLGFEISRFEPVAGTGECFLSYRRR